MLHRGGESLSRERVTYIVAGQKGPCIGRARPEGAPYRAEGPELPRGEGEL
jgi:hypothetical protein